MCFGLLQEVNRMCCMHGPAIEPLPTERFLSLKDAAGVIGVPSWALRKAVKSGVVPGYRQFGTKWLVPISEVSAAIEHSRKT
jgi:excisionase family DNA binding protein